MDDVYFDTFCNRDNDGPLWSNNLTLNTLDPNFTTCFQYTALCWAPIAWLAISMPFKLYNLYTMRTVVRFQDISRWNLLKTALIIILALIMVLNILKYVADDVAGTQPHGIAFVFSPALLIIALLYVVLITHYEFRKGINSSGTLFVFWFLQFVVSTVQTVSASEHLNIMKSFNDSLTLHGYSSVSPSYFQIDPYRYGLLLVSYALVIVIAVVNLVPDNKCVIHRLRYEEEEEKNYQSSHYGRATQSPQASTNNSFGPENNTQQKLCPELFAPYILRITFWWFTGLTWTGFRRTLTLDDCWQLLSEYRSNKLVSIIVNRWEEEVHKTVRKQRGDKNWRDEPSLQKGLVLNSVIRSLPDNMVNPAFLDDEGETKISSKNAQDLLDLRLMHNQPGTKKKYEPSLVAAAWSVIGPLYLLNCVLRLIYDLLTFAQPQLLNLLIDVVIGINPIKWHGFVLTAALFAVGAVRSLVLAGFFHTGMMCGLKLRTALTGLVYRKALVLSTSGKKDSTVGEIVNLMSVDIQRIQDGVAFLNLLWSAPLVVTVSVLMLYWELGYAALAGFGAMLLLVPINIFIAGGMRKYQGEQMVHKDERIKLSTEILNGMKVLKLYGWEMAYNRVIDVIRNNEVEVLKKLSILTSGLTTSVLISPFIVAAVSFIVYVLDSPTNVLTANIISVSLSLINIMNFPLSFFPQVIAMAIQVAISVGRIRKYLIKDEILPDSVTHSRNASRPVTISDGTFSWDRDDEAFLKSINLKVNDGELLAVVGPVGSGKSSLLHAILGEMHKVKGSVTLRGRLAYVPQQAWIINATVRDNILFGQEYNKDKYDRVVQACALQPDFKIMLNGDLTEVGERGINMSGGQKQRISLARAVYQNSDIYILDDPLSAVDSHVAKHIFEQVLGPTGLLAHKTRILVTHAVNILPKMEQIALIKDGRITENGTFDDLIKQNGEFAEFIREYLLEEESDEEEESTTDRAEFKKELMRQISAISNDEKIITDRQHSTRHRSQADGDSISNGLRMRSRSTAKQAAKVEKTAEVPQTKLIQDESTQVGSVKADVYIAYLKALGLSLTSVAIVAYVLYVAGGVATNIWLSEWSGDSMPGSTQDYDLVYLRIGVYAGLGGFQMVVILIHSICLAYATTRASRLLHDAVFSRLLRAPMSFFDTTPLGRITNRLSKDMDTVDVLLPMTMKQWLITLALVLQTIVLIVISNWLLILMLIPLIVIFVFVQSFYINTSRQLKRIDSVLRSPIFTHFQNSLQGATSVRAYRISDRFALTSDQLVDRSMTAYYSQCIAFRWLGVSLECLSNIMILVVGMVFVGSTGIDVNLASLAITYTMTMTNALTMVVRSMTDLETYVVSIERLKEYSEVETEAPLQDPADMRVPQDWPSSGRIEFANYSVRYRAGLDLVLKGINCKIESNEKVGIIGRTGAGKSSLSMALFRLLEPSNGTILIDGVDITRLGLQTLRSRITIIPQEPVLFSGTLRRNIDPFGNHSDDQIWLALECAHLKSFVQSQTAGLDFMCSEGGENLSVGQRQLLCMARAALRRSKVLMLDEATAAVDVETDQLIQKTIRSEFRNCTILTIAHRLNTVLDYDKILVLDQGCIKEFDSPTNLLSDRSSQFYSMAKDAGLVHD